MKAKWNKNRANELNLMSALLYEVSCLNSGSHVIERIRYCITLANKLNNGNIRTGRQSFNQFISDLCIADRTKKVKP